ncbi:DNA cytosine methyltransferase [Tenacibaculum maritimum]|uniref:DNA cytosine methyltransferase n=1 Tax=Tenacibaculum maritimum TaxID=107401 RepID=UPI0004100AFD|nr:DNA cytosine methyltransferase [Tenacibaculum maritimum]MCD9580467.1 DNA cytosine methyltransferase [Tenacibaculum maritimum]MCD9634897.1 DNA cytosine methyltransferase [Tenacibaculum maritimum]CAA0180518.1 DNA (Cytosine-5)-methyltransferase [Tenacibaculum maritimum]CAA0252631.1 DNA (Cytosine-5)-methyltransferase 1 [Tenacibaculum maritimum]
MGILTEDELSLHTDNNISKNPVGCDIFSGAGGMSLGAEMAGIDISFAVENDKYAADTFIKNHRSSKVILEDIRNVRSTDLISKNPFVLFGGPPCQGFSLSNTVTRNSKNEKNSLFEEFLRFIEELEPEWCVFENVEGFRSFQKGKVVKILKKRLEDIGYTVNFDVLMASDYGVPQDRKRFFMIGNKNGIKFEFPEPLTNKFTVADAISDLPNLQNGDFIESLPYKGLANNEFANTMRANSSFSMQNYVSRNKDYVLERYKYIGQGENWKAIPDELMANYADKNNCHSGIYKRLDSTKPSIVISNYRKNMLIHPFENRGLSVREAARLQSFPDDFIFKGTLMYIQQQIGNAVPPLLAKALFDQINQMTYNG